MKLSKLIERKSLTVLGLNSATSADSLDMAVVKIGRAGAKKTIKILKHSEVKYPKSLKRKMEDIINSDIITFTEFISLNNSLGKFFGKSSKKYIDKLKNDKINIDLIASHGQTIAHFPEMININKKKQSGTLQIGALSEISVQTGKITVGNFRQTDIALGNEGAPITVEAMKQLLESENKPIIIVNIGGISNFFYFPSHDNKLIAQAGDCGPGNSLTDILTQKLYNKPFDKLGEIAKTGEISSRLLLLLIKNSQLLVNSISTGKEVYGEKLSKQILDYSKQLSLKNQDILASVGEFTAQMIAKKLIPLLKSDENLLKLYLTGGGRKNKFFIDRIEANLKGIKVEPIEKIGLCGDSIEAVSYAIMGETSIRSEPMKTVFIKGKQQKILPVLGEIVQPPVIIQPSVVMR